MSEPILDVVRGLSTVASFAIVINQLKETYSTFFVSTCEHCRGTGLLTCPHCHGTATLLRRPGMLLVRTLAVANSSDALYGCVFCGGYALPELSMGGGGNDESTAVKVYENLRQALVNRYPLPHRMPVLAGTVPCKTCHGSGKVARLTPVTGRALGLERAWSRGITSRLGRRYLFKENRPADRQRLFMEYPGEPQPDAHSMPDVVEKPPIVYPPGPFRSGREPSMPLQLGPFEIVLTNRGNMENFIMPFIDYDSDENEDNVEEDARPDDSGGW
ncbi:hypothetical protein F751_4691 [Auxenochlorella protothecoides]|uniref:Uncharacterized protein n=1 Tax=Auxenochlorella protothecoides TaxID=3075 RepID=A0A087SKE4_AUXPR|nr:hypothetical protein F751_4691 [Auxenochlorella protothecoides]KFM26198.1 hypothetical protein F751_4691 [Auxenochlorella protothecoides]